MTGPLVTTVWLVFGCTLTALIARHELRAMAREHEENR